MSPPCQRCAANRLINLDTAQRIGVVSGCLVGSAFRATATTHALPTATARLPVASQVFG